MHSYDVSEVIRLINPSYPSTVKPGGKEVPARFLAHLSFDYHTADLSQVVIPCTDRAANMYLVKTGDKCEMLPERKAFGMLRAKRIDAVPCFEDITSDIPIVKMTVSGGKDPRWCVGKGADKLTAHKKEMSAGLAGLVDFLVRCGG